MAAPTIAENPYGSYFLITINNPTMTPALLEETISKKAAAKYFTFQKEQGENGTPHYQCYLETSKSVRLSTIRSWVEGHVIAVKPQPGDQGDYTRMRIRCRNYCRKDETRIEGPWEWHVDGIEWRVKTEQGKRNDIIDFKRKMDTPGMTEQQLALEEDSFAMWAKHQKIVAKYMTFKIPNRTKAPEVIIAYGPPGTGKSTWAVGDGCEGKSFFIKPANDKWWDGYEGQEVVIFDDFAGQHPWQELMTVCSLLTPMVQIKGSMAKMVASKLIFTTNVDPKLWYDTNNVKHPWEALERRVTEWCFFWSKETPGTYRSYKKYSEFKAAIDSVLACPETIEHVGDDFDWIVPATPQLNLNGF